MKIFIAVLAVALGETAVATPSEGALKAGQTFRDCPECPEMVVVPAGNFLMGSSAADADRDIAVVTVPFIAGYVRGYLAEEQPQHPVRIGQSVALGKYPVTRREFAAFVKDTGYVAATDCTFYRNNRYSRHPGSDWRAPGFPQSDDMPVVCVSWEDANAYITWLNGKLGGSASASGEGPYRLPSEAEWEYAARAGTQTARWWGNDLGVDNADCDGCGSAWDKQGTAPVDSFRANQFGLFDMLGNASQWTRDCWNPNYDGAPSDGTAWLTGDCGQRVRRGGDWSSGPWVIRSADRTRESIDRGANYIGFRVLKTFPDARGGN
jgi:formylglycine-generating enzyme required for sulfatase activity